MSKKFYITTAIDYVNAAPHIGHALEKVQADVLARYQRQKDRDVFFLTGTDENSLKNVQAAKVEKISTQELVDRNSAVFKSLKEALNLSFDGFIRTTEQKHVEGAQKLWQACRKEDIYKKKYKGIYCVDCEMFYKESELIDGLCPEHKTKPQVVEEENYFFKLTNYQKQLEELIESDKLKIIPKSKKNEMLSFIKQGLEDFSISRSAQRAQGWGVSVPEDKTQIQYVWFDALSNYLTGIGYTEESDQFKKLWPCDLHVIGKGILRFHAIYWPAMLLSSGLELPKSIFVHGYLTIDGQKISKSLGNTVDPIELASKYSLDVIRYYLLREISSTEDGDFSIKRLEERYNADLANGLGNLVSRVLTLSQKVKKINEKPIDEDLSKQTGQIHEKYKKAMQEIKFNEALEAIWQLISLSDEYVEKNKPWELIKKNQDKFDEVLSCLLIRLKAIAEYLRPFLPETADKIIEQVKVNKKTESLFPRL